MVTLPATAVQSCRAHAVDAWWVRFNAETSVPKLEVYMRLIHPEGIEGPCKFCTAPAYFYYDT